MVLSNVFQYVVEFLFRDFLIRFGQTFEEWQEKIFQCLHSFFMLGDALPIGWNNNAIRGSLEYDLGTIVGDVVSQCLFHFPVVTQPFQTSYRINNGTIANEYSVAITGSKAHALTDHPRTRGVIQRNGWHQYPVHIGQDATLSNGFQQVALDLEVVVGVRLTV